MYNMWYIDYRLIKSSVEVNVRHSLGWTPLHVAVINGQLGYGNEVITIGVTD